MFQTAGVMAEGFSLRFLISETQFRSIFVVDISKVTGLSSNNSTFPCCLCYSTNIFIYLLLL